jgi:hypothetical protein
MAKVNERSGFTVGTLRVHVSEMALCPTRAQLTDNLETDY